MDIKRPEHQSVLLGMADYVKNGTLFRNSAVRMVFVTSSSELNNLKPHYGPGSIAIQIGLEHAWQLGINNTWVSIF